MLSDHHVIRIVTTLTLFLRLLVIFLTLPSFLATILHIHAFDLLVALFDFS